MKVEVQEVGTVDVFAPAGPLVDQDAVDFTAYLHERVCTGSPRIVVLMREVPYVDSVAIEGLLDAADELAERASGLKLVEVTSTCREIFELTGVSGRFTFFEGVQDAVRSFL